MKSKKKKIKDEHGNEVVIMFTQLKQEKDGLRDAKWIQVDNPLRKRRK